MKSKFLCSLMVCFVSLTVFAVPKNWAQGPDKSWYVSLEEALSAAKKENKKVYLVASGSDWCPPCMRLKKDVFDKKDFQRFAKKNLILVYIDFPRRKAMPAEQKTYNQRTASRLKLGGGVPSAVILDANGKELGKISGYAKEKDYMKKLKSIVGKK